MAQRSSAAGKRTKGELKQEYDRLQTVHAAIPDNKSDAAQAVAERMRVVQRQINQKNNGRPSQKKWTAGRILTLAVLLGLLSFGWSYAVGWWIGR